MAKTIHLFASLGNIKKTAAGGGQTSARRLVKVLEGLDYNVQVVNRTIPPYTIESLAAKLYKGVGFIVDPIRFFCHLFVKHRKDAIVLVVGYSGELFPYYLLFIKIGKLLGYKTMFYVKGGFTEAKYTGFPESLKNKYKKGLKYVDFALYEGEEGASLSTKVMSKTRSIWLPNFVENDFVPKQFPVKSKEIIKMLYFGRIHPDKNVVMIVELFDYLCATHNNLFLTIVGSGEKDYERLLNEKISNSLYVNRIERISRIAHDNLKDILTNHHFFVFPSIEAQEGHSNSLNEAMSFGLVPVVSDNNFLPSIVGVERLVVHELKVETYASVVETIIRSGDYDNLSHSMYERVSTYFTQHVVEQNLKEVIELL